jgi:ABC-type uncharacterized transport system ATPase subunit
MPGEKVGLVGANGAGKSTLLRCLIGTRGIDSGRILVGQRVQLGYLEQTAVSGSTRTVWEEARSRMMDVIQAEADIESAAAAADRGTGLITCLGLRPSPRFSLHLSLCLCLSAPSLSVSVGGKGAMWCPVWEEAQFRVIDVI